MMNLRTMDLRLPDGTPVESIDAHPETVDVTPLMIIDLAWRYVDPAGHEHRWHQRETRVGAPPSGDLPTLEEIIDVEGSEPDADDYYPSITHYECRACRAHVEPRYTANNDQYLMAGLKRYRVNGRSATPEEVVFLKAQVERLTGPQQP